MGLFKYEKIIEYKTKIKKSKNGELILADENLKKPADFEMKKQMKN